MIALRITVVDRLIEKLGAARKQRKDKYLWEAIRIMKPTRRQVNFSTRDKS